MMKIQQQPSSRCFALVFWAALAAAVVQGKKDICTSENNVFTVKLNLFAGELGYYQFEECGDMVNPTIGMEIGETYTFLQTDISNYFHPMGFAYFADGAHKDVDELEPGITQTDGNECAASNSCSAPMYFLNDEYLGTYNNLPEQGDLTTDEDNFGLDDYEPKFFLPMLQWKELGDFSIKLRFDDENYDRDIFYFCHIHEYMTGRIKLLKNGKPVSDYDAPGLGYQYDQIDNDFDQACGTYNLNLFQLPQDVCPERFVCPTAQTSQALQRFSACIEAMNCFMFAGMTTNVQAGSNEALFMHQMIPHHQNAVNMAKALLKTGTLDSCTDIMEETDDCTLKVMMYEIINGQNFQIQTMNSLLEANDGYPLKDNCDVVKPSVEVKSSTGGGNGRDRNLQQQGDDVCTSETNVFTVKLNLFAGELGYYQFEECGDMVNPTIGMEIGETYTFVQQDVTNYFHPMGFAYFPDGAHQEVDELEPGITQTAGNTCEQFLNCSAPMYFLDGNSLGTYNNLPEQGDLTTGEDNFGLDDYEPLFFHPITEWSGYGEFSIKLRFTDEDYQDDIFYFCHIHEFMTGRIKLLKNGVVVNVANTPPIDYEYNQPGEFDKTCGTYDLDDFVLPNPICPDRFVCNVQLAPRPVQQFSTCIDAMNCHMLGGMTLFQPSMTTGGSEKALFIHQMIPHHQNAVNMAKALLNSGSLDCNDVTEETEDCVLQAMMYEIINGQNFQIQAMQNIILGNTDYTVAQNCDVPFVAATEEEEEDVPVPAPAPKESSKTEPSSDEEGFVPFLPIPSSEDASLDDDDDSAGSFAAVPSLAIMILSSLLAGASATLLAY